MDYAHSPKFVKFFILSQNMSGMAMLLCPRKYVRGSKLLS